MSYVNVNAICSPIQDDVDYCQSKKEIIFFGTPYQKTIMISNRLQDAAFVDSFINPNGTQYYVGSCGHSHFAYDHCEGKSVSELERIGWLHFSKAYTENIIVNTIVGDFTATQAQIDTLFDIIMDANKIQERLVADGDFRNERIDEQIKYINKFITNNNK